AGGMGRAAAAGGGKARVLGIGVGGSRGRERVWVDEEFRSAIVRHHAVDKTFRPGHLHPDQGYAELSVRVEDVSIWGLGGKVAEDKRVAFQQREQLFTEQRRKGTGAEGGGEMVEGNGAEGGGETG
ncbi:unnamed protein product, partial [Closterium sp. NIES-53]